MSQRNGMKRSEGTLGELEREVDEARRALAQAETIYRFERGRVEERQSAEVLDAAAEKLQEARAKLSVAKNALGQAKWDAERSR